jgi:hypothetical protein
METHGVRGVQAVISTAAYHNVLASQLTSSPLRVYRLIIELFRTLEFAGYSFRATVDVKPSIYKMPLRQIFERHTRNSSHAHFFGLKLSRTGHKVTLVDTPPDVYDTLVRSIRARFDGLVTIICGPEPGVYVIRSRRKMLLSVYKLVLYL